MNRKALIARVVAAYAKNNIPWTDEAQVYADRLGRVALSDLALHWECNAFRARVEQTGETSPPSGKPLFGGPNPNVKRIPAES